MINVNNAKAVEIAKDKIRIDRKPKLEALDVEFQIALESGADTSSIVAQKKALRDATKQVEGLDVNRLIFIIDGLDT